MSVKGSGKRERAHLRVVLSIISKGSSDLQEGSSGEELPDRSSEEVQGPPESSRRSVRARSRPTSSSLLHRFDSRRCLPSSIFVICSSKHLESKVLDVSLTCKLVGDGVVVGEDDFHLEEERTGKGRRWEERSASFSASFLPSSSLLLTLPLGRERHIS